MERGRELTKEEKGERGHRADRVQGPDVRGTGRGRARGNLGYLRLKNGASGGKGVRGTGSAVGRVSKHPSACSDCIVFCCGVGAPATNAARGPRQKLMICRANLLL